MSNIFDDRPLLYDNLRCDGPDSRDRVAFPINDVICVKARGYKNRIVTKSHPGLVCAAHPIREKVLRFLSLDPRIRTVLKGEKEAAIREI